MFGALNPGFQSLAIVKLAQWMSFEL